jgi:peptidyl-prolyl cis-trans isomerase C
MARLITSFSFGYKARSWIGIVLLASALTACQKHPAGQVVAIVNGQEITAQELVAEAQAAGIDADFSQKSIISKLLQRVINRDLLADYAKQSGLDRSPEYVLRRQQLAQTLLADLAARKIAGGSTLPPKNEVDAYIVAHPMFFAQRQRLALNQVTFPTPANSETLKSIIELQKIDDVVAKLASLNIQYTTGNVTMDTASVDPNIARQVLALKDGEVFDLSTGGKTYISVITARTTAAGEPTTWPTVATNAIRVEKLTKAVGNSLKDIRDKATIEYNPQFKPVN